MSGVWLITGVQAAGKTTVADGLARRFEAGVHVRGGQLATDLRALGRIS